MRILVTGGAGFVGSHVADGFISEGYEVAILDNLSTGFKQNIPAKAKFYEGDIRDVGFVRQAFEDFKPEVVDHHAAQMDVRKSLEDPIYDAECNIMGFINIIKESVRSGVKRFIYASTGGAGYGNPKTHPCSEDDPINPISAYGITKHTAEHYLFLYSYLHGIEYVILRYPNVYGERQNPHGEAGVIAIFTKQLLNGWSPIIYGDGSQTRDYLYISDVVRANIISLTKGTNGIFNIGSMIETSVKEIYSLIASALKTNLQPIHEAERVGEVSRICLNNKKAKEELSWHPEVSLVDGISRTVGHIKHNFLNNV